MNAQSIRQKGSTATSSGAEGIRPSVRRRASCSDKANGAHVEPFEEPLPPHPTARRHRARSQNVSDGLSLGNRVSDSFFHQLGISQWIGARIENDIPVHPGDDARKLAFKAIDHAGDHDQREHAHGNSDDGDPSNEGQKSVRCLGEQKAPSRSPTAETPRLDITSPRMCACGRISGKRMTSRILGESVKSMTRRSMPMPMFQQMGFGVAVALLLDATLIRSIVLPCTLSLLGERSWYLPRWLNWLPRIEVESPEVVPVADDAERILVAAAV